MTEIMQVLEIIGTIAFAVSGALVAIGTNLDLFGVIFIGTITAVGGGITRDIILGIHPPLIFSTPFIFIISFAVSVIIFITAYIYRERYDELRHKIETINNIFDAIGLAVFSVVGVEVGYTNGFANNELILVIIGMLTGVGGGIYRDILTDSTPYVLKKHIYAIASIIGSSAYVLLRHNGVDAAVSSAAAMVIIFVIRMLATKYEWTLPRIICKK